jgi:sulfite exporter TauE/SafE
MIPLIATLFAASILGSLHCAGMCGPFVAIAVGSGERKVLTQSAYHAGRLVTYLILGLLAGAAGQLVNLGSTLAGIQPVAAGLAGATMVFFGGITLLRVWGWKIPAGAMPPLLMAILRKGHLAAAGAPPVVRAGAIGLLTTFLPCGWLYAFVLVAAGTASAAQGAMTMAVFWAGTLPILVARWGGMCRR